MAESISFPFRVLPNGRVATNESTSEQAEREAIAVLVLTRPGEREMVPAFGISDPTFQGISAAELTAAIALFGPPVRLLDVASTFPDDSSQVAVLTIE